MLMSEDVSIGSMRYDKVAQLKKSWAWETATQGEIFHDPDIFEFEMERIFQGDTWHAIGHICEFPEDGVYKLHRIGRIPLIVSRSEGDIHVLVNACAHRGAQVVRGSRGKAERGAAFTCIYHQWSYDLSGKTIGVGLRQGYGADFPMGEHRLARARVSVVGGVIFASLGNNPPSIEAYLGERVIGYLERLYGADDLVYLGVQRVVFQCNWKLYVENIYDSYHAVTLHKGFRLMRIRKPAPQLEDPAIVRFGHYLSEYEAELPSKVDLANPEIFEMRSRQDGLSGHVISNIFPASQLTEQLDVLAIRSIVPKGPAATEIQFHVYAKQGDSDELRRHRLWQASNFLGPQGLINLEDAAALARVQASLHGRDRHFDNGHGRRFPERRSDEFAIDSFYRAYFAALFGEGTPEAKEGND